MIDLRASDVRPFLPARDFALSKDFYTALGWTLDWCDAQLALLRIGTHCFYLQNYYAREWAENCMLHVSVEDAQACYTQIQTAIETGRFPETRVTAPKQEPYGALVTYVWDPSGVLLHMAQWT